MVYLIWAILAILSFVRKRSKVVTLLVAAFIACIFCFNTANADLYNYQMSYLNDGKFSRFEPLYLLMGRIFHSYGFSFEVFRACMSITCIGLITATIFRFSPFPAWTLWLYSLCLMTLDVTQFRFFIGYSIVFFSTRFLVDYQIQPNLKDVILFFALLLLAAGFHYSCALYGILGLLFLNIQKRKRFLLVFVPLCVIIFALSFQQLVPLTAGILPAVQIETWVAAEKVMSLRNTLKIVLTRPMPLAYSVFVSFVVRTKKYARIVGKNENSLGIAGTGRPQRFAILRKKSQYYDLRVNQCLFSCFLYICLFVILELTVAGQYERLFRLGLLIAAVLISRQISYLTPFNQMSAQIMLTLVYALYFISMMYFTYTSEKSAFIDIVFRLVMESNSLFGVTY